MNEVMRIYQNEADYWQIRNFLREVFVHNNRRMLSWPVARLDYWRWHGIMNLGDGTLETGVYLWENPDGQIMAVLNREAAGQAFLQIHPSFNTEGLEEQMIAQAEAHLRTVSRRGGEVLWIWSDSMDFQRQAILEKRGYAPVTEAREHQWRCDLEQSIRDKPLNDEYTIRSLGEATELPSRSWASWRAFHPDEPDENYDNDISWYLNIQSAPLYCRDLDLVATTSTGEIVAFTTVWYDDATHSGYFEPVGTIPEHQRRGLASALLCEGMRRLKHMGATLATTIGGEPPANALYESVLGPDFDLSVPWEKRWRG